jgi:tRNA(Ile2) C34 agmatinyltransferase TiaS
MYDTLKLATCPYCASSSIHNLGNSQYHCSGCGRVLDREELKFKPINRRTGQVNANSIEPNPAPTQNTTAPV